MSTNIPYLDEVWNLTRGCTKISAGCAHCYASRFSERFHGFAFDGTVELCEDKMLERPLHWRKPRRVGVCFMSDLFHEKVPDEFLDRVFAMMALTPQHTYVLLTKRPERMRAYLAWRDDKWPRFDGSTETRSRHDEVVEAIANMGLELEDWPDDAFDDWPLPNVWLGVSVEDQQAADERIPLLLETPAAHRWVSCEPCLSMIDLGQWFDTHSGGYDDRCRDGVPSTTSDRGLFHRPTGANMAASLPESREQNRDTAGRKGYAEASSGNDSDKGSSESTTSGQGREDNGVRSQTRLDGREPVRHIDRAGDQPQGRESYEQQPGELGTSNPSRQCDPCDAGLGEDEARGGSQRLCQVDRGSGAGDSLSSGEQHPATAPDRSSVRSPNQDGSGHSLSKHLEAPHLISPISWVVVGGESGPKARECHVGWIAEVVNQCREASVPAYVKQDSGPRPGMQGRIPDALWAVKQLPGGWA